MAIELTLSDEEARLLARAANSCSNLMTDFREQKDKKRLKFLAERINLELKYNSESRR